MFERKLTDAILGRFRRRPHLVSIFTNSATCPAKRSFQALLVSRKIRKHKHWVCCRTSATLTGILWRPKRRCRDTKREHTTDTHFYRQRRSISASRGTHSRIHIQIRPRSFIIFISSMFPTKYCFFLLLDHYLIPAVAIVTIYSNLLKDDIYDKHFLLTFFWFYLHYYLD